MNRPYLTFGEYLSVFMQNRGYTGTSLAKLLGEKSPTVISRLKADKCTPARCEAFLQQLIDTFGDITSDELFCFQRGIKVLTLGKDSYTTYRAIHTLFTGAQQADTPHGNLHELLQLPPDTESCDVICMQCTDTMITDELVALLTGCTASINIRHFITMPLQTSSARFAVSMLPVLCDPRYELTELHFPHGNPHLGISAINFVFMRITQNGEAAYRLLLPCEDGNAISLSIASEINYKHCMKLIHALNCQFIPVNQTYLLNGPTDLHLFLSDLAAHESNREAYMFKRDFCFQFLLVDVVQSAFTDMLSSLPAEYTNAVTELRRLCYVRHRNILEASQPIRMLLSRESLRDFMKTGMLNDHFYGLRPFTLEERKAILLHIINLAASNPNISLHLANEEAIFGDYDFFVYDQYGVQIAPSHTNYHRPYAIRNAGHTEVMLRDPLLAAHMKTYFSEYLIPGYACSAEESLQYLRSLLR